MDKKQFDICVIGVSNIDIHVESEQEVSNDTSVIGDVFLKPGGVGRNIAFGLAEIGVGVSFVSIFSNDLFGQFLLQSLKHQYICLDDSIFNAKSTSKYVNIVTANENFGVNDIKNIDEFSVPFFEKKMSNIDKMKYVLVDLNMTSESLEYIANNLSSKLICEATSSIKCGKIKKILNHVYLLKANFTEARVIAECDDDIGYQDLLACLLEKGVNKTYITLGRGGALYGEGNLRVHAKYKEALSVKDALGAGDVFMVGILYGEQYGWKNEEVLIFAMNLSYCYLLHGLYELDEKILKQALNMKRENVELFYWNEENKRWIIKKE